jgi:hypothetical protein
MDSRLKANDGSLLGSCLRRSQNNETEGDSAVWSNHGTRRRPCRRVARYDTALRERSESISRLSTLGDLEPTFQSREINSSRRFCGVT